MALSKDETVSGNMSTAKTQDIVNTLRTKGGFHTMLDCTNGIIHIVDAPLMPQLAE